MSWVLYNSEACNKNAPSLEAVWRVATYKLSEGLAFFKS
jgi:hypothetical protein